MPEGSVNEKAAASAAVEARIRRRSRPVLSAEEREAVATVKAIDEATLASMKCREAAAAQEARATEWEDAAEQLKEKLKGMPTEAAARALELLGGSA